MRLAKYPQNVRVGLTHHVKAWCLCIKARTGDLPIEEIERQLLGGTSAGRQWSRWQTGQVPSAQEFVAATSAARDCGWLQADLAVAIVTSFESQRSTVSEGGSRSGWNQTIALEACYKFAEELNDKALLDHCEMWRMWIYGPPENSPAFADWLAKKEAGWTAEDEEILQESIFLIVEQALVGIYNLGLPKPHVELYKSLKKVLKVWPDIKKILDEDSQHK